MKAILKRAFVLSIFCYVMDAEAQNVFPSVGNVGIGTSSPGQKLTIAGGSIQIASPNLGLIFYGGGEKIIGTSDWGIEFQTAIGSRRMKIHNDGKITIGSTAGAYSLMNVAGDIRITNLLQGLVFAGGGEKIIGTTDYGIEFQTSNGSPRMKIFNNGVVTIGSTSTPAGYKLYVQSGIMTERVKVAVNGTANWSDYVFANNYHLKSLFDLEKFILANKHLPGIPSAEEMVKEGNDLGKTDARLLAKIEELTLYIIEINKRNELLEKRVKALEGKED